MSSVQKDKQNLKKRMEQSVHEAFSVSRKPLKSYAWLDPIFFGRNQRRLLKHTPIYILKVTQKYIFLVFGILINKVTLPASFSSLYCKRYTNQQQQSSGFYSFAVLFS